MIEIPVGVRLKVLNLNEFKKNVAAAAAGKASGGGGEAAGGAASAGGGATVSAIAKGNFIALAAMKILEKVADALKGIFEKMKSASPALQGIMLTLEKAMLIFFKPFGDFLALLLRPMAIQLIKFARDFAKTIKGLFNPFGGGSTGSGGNNSGFAINQGGAAGKPGAPGAPGAPGGTINANLTLDTKGLSEGLKNAVAKFFTDLGTNLAKSVNDFAPNIQTFISKLSDLVFLAIIGLGVAIYSFLANLKIEAAGGIAKEILLGMIKVVFAVMDLMLLVIAGLMVFVFNALKDNAKAIWTLLNIYVFEPLGKFFGQVVGILTDQITKLKKDIEDLWLKITTKVTEVKDKFLAKIDEWKTSMESILTNLYNAISGALADIGNRVKKIIDDAFASGSKAVSDLWNSVTGQKHQVGSDFIANDGMHYLHRGETVISASKGASAGKSMSFQFGNTYVTVPAGTNLDEEKLAQRITDNNRILLRRAMSYG